MINGIKHVYIVVTTKFSTFFSRDRKNEEQFPGLLIKVFVLLFMVKPKRKRKKN